MSAPNIVLEEADQLRLGVLSIKASSALRSALAEQPLGNDEKDALKQAAQFLTEVADGERIAMSGTFRAGSRPSRSMAALDLAEMPIDELRIHGNRAGFLAAMATAVLNTATKSQLNAQRRRVAQSALVFFDALHRVLQQQRELRRLLGTSPKRRATA